jgi:hypothetical protein
VAPHCIALARFGFKHIRERVVALFGALLRHKLIDRSRCLDHGALSLQVRAGRSYSPAVGIEDRDPITVVVLVMKFKFIAVVAMCPTRHDGAHETILRAAAIPSQY